MDAYIRRCRSIFWLAHALLLTLCSCSAVIAHAQGDILVPPYTSIPVKYSGWIIYISYSERLGGMSVNADLQFDTPVEACQSLLSDPAWGAGAYGQFGCVNAQAVPQAGSPDWGMCSCADPNRPGTYIPACSEGTIMGMGDNGRRICLTPTTCPDNSTGTPPLCTCDNNYEPDSTKTSCVPVLKCPVEALKTFPEDDACALALENLQSTQAQKDAACGTLSQAMKDGKACFADKLSAINIPGTTMPIPLKVTAEMRNLAYQAHFREIWDKMEVLAQLMKKNSSMKTACEARLAEIAAEKGCNNAGPCKSCYSESAIQRSHCLIAMPALPNPNDAKHTQGKAMDLSLTRTIKPLNKVLKSRNPPQNISQFLDAPSTPYPNGCGLIWGGTFKTNKDPVHFFVR